jgi:hypothetical protein
MVSEPNRSSILKMDSSVCDGFIPITLEYQYSTVSHEQFRFQGKIIMHVFIMKYYFNTQIVLSIVIFLCTNSKNIHLMVY